MGSKEGRDGTITLNDGSNSYIQSALIIIPILIIIVVLDFAIFGTFASRSDELNPISHFFFHARNGLQNLRNRRRHGYGYHPDQHYLHQRSVDSVGPVLAAMAAAEDRYN